MAFEVLTEKELAEIVGGVGAERVNEIYTTAKDYARGGCGCGGGH